MTWHNDIYVVADRPGNDSWQTLVNGKMVPGGGGNKFTSSRTTTCTTLCRILNGKAVYNAGDTFAVRIFHVATDGQRYAAVNSLCRIVGR